MRRTIDVCGDLPSTTAAQHGPDDLCATKSNTPVRLQDRAPTLVDIVVVVAVAVVVNAPAATAVGVVKRSATPSQDATSTGRLPVQQLRSYAKDTTVGRLTWPAPSFTT